jgi:thiamine pyrophosphate-dependent acetolactate synthase large subunit-like protein
MMGLGLALAQPRRPVLVLTGDGEQLMGIGALATIAVQKPANLCVVVLDNGRFGETGMQVSHTAMGVDLLAIGRACGIGWTVDVADDAGLQSLADRIGRCEGCGLARVPIHPVNPPKVIPPRDGVYLKDRMRLALGLTLN